MSAKVIAVEDEASMGADGGANGEDTKEEEKHPEEKQEKPVPFCKMFSLASPAELAMLFVGTFAAFINGGSQPAMVYIWGRMIDSVGPEGPNMMGQVQMMCYVGIATAVAATLQSHCLRMFARSQSAKMRALYYEAILYQDISWFDVTTTASLGMEVNDDAEKMGNAFGDKFANGIQGGSCFFVGMGVGFYFGWKLALVILAAVPLMALGMIFMGKAMEDTAMENQGWYADAAALVEEKLFALRTVVAFGGERKEIDEYKRSIKEAKKGAVKNVYVTAFGMGYVECVWACANAAALYFGMTLIYDQEVNESTGKVWTGGDILIVFFSILIGGFSIGQMEPTMKALKEGRVAAARFFKVYESKPVIQPALVQRRGQDSRQRLETFEGFEFSNVHFSYPARPDVPVLKGLSFQIKSGQKVAFVGESGSGKSTVMSLLERFYDPAQGVVMVNGVDVKQFSPGSLRALIGYVGQEPVLFATTVRNNIMQGDPNATDAALSDVMRMAQCDFVEQLPEGKNTFVGSGGSQFSGGQKQRIAIARALLRKPKVLFLDEATSALDSQSEKMIQETLEHIGKSGAALTTVAIAHRLSTVRDSDVIFTLMQGAVVEQGTHEVLMEKKGAYYGLAAAQEKGMAGQDGKAHGPVTVDLDDDNNNMPSGAEDKSNGAKQAWSRQKSPEDGDLKKQESSVSKGMAAMALSDEKAEKERQAQVAKTYKTPMRRLLSYNKPEWILFLPGIVGALLHGSNNPVQAFLIVGILDAFLKPLEEMKEDITELSIMFACLGAITFVATAMHTSCFGILAENMTMRLRGALLTHIFRQEIGFHDDPEHTPGVIGTALSLWTYRVRTFMQDLESKASVGASIIVGLALAFWGCWQVALAMLAAIPVLAIAGMMQMAAMLGGAGARDEKMKIAQQVVSDSVQNARTVHACSMEAGLTKYHTQLIKECNRGMALQTFASAAAFGFSLAAPMFVLAWGFWLSDDLVRRGDATFKDVMVAFMCIMYAAMGAGQFASLVGDASKAKVACHDMFELMDRETLIDGLDPVGDKPEENAVGQIEFENVQFFYPFRPDVQVLKGVNFKIESGQSVGLVGPSGGGKSTIMSLIQRFYDPAQGSIYIGSRRTKLSGVDIRWWRKQVGFVGQEPILFNTSVLANVKYGLEEGETISEERLAECKKMAHLEFLDNDNNQGWATEVGARGARLSGGQKQRVAICRAMVRNPPVLLLDEATSALDNESERVVQQALEAAREGRTSFAIAHRLSTIQDCNVILVTAEGVIVEAGSHTELMAKEGVYYKLQARPSA